MENNSRVMKAAERIGRVIGYILAILLNLYFTVGIAALIILPIFGKISWWWLLTIIPLTLLTHKLYKK